MFFFFPFCDVPVRQLYHFFYFKSLLLLTIDFFINKLPHGFVHNKDVSHDPNSN